MFNFSSIIFFPRVNFLLNPSIFIVFIFRVCMAFFIIWIIFSRISF
uniref:Uncharacterized protein n=1 Tax=Bacteriophage sp. TaxID=38018 RepID=A0A8D9PEE2_9VIRU|nr:MAG TPA: hypothetical protein [Bacteriophage sp.]